MANNIPEFVPHDADKEEAAAIVAAVSTHLQEQEVEDEDATSWQGDRWQFAGRMEVLLQRDVQISTNAPTDNWTASGRIGWMG